MDAARIRIDETEDLLRITVGPSRRTEGWRRGVVVVILILGTSLLASRMNDGSSFDLFLRLIGFLAIAASLPEVGRVALLLFGREDLEVDPQKLSLATVLFGVSWRRSVLLGRIRGVGRKEHRLPLRYGAKIHFSVVVQLEDGTVRLASELSMSDAETLAAHLQGFISRARAVLPYE